MTPSPKGCGTGTRKPAQGHQEKPWRESWAVSCRMNRSFPEDSEGECLKAEGPHYMQKQGGEGQQPKGERLGEGSQLDLKTSWQVGIGSTSHSRKGRGKEVSRAGWGGRQGKRFQRQNRQGLVAPPLGMKAPCPESLSWSEAGPGRKPGTLAPRAGESLEPGTRQALRG